MPSIKTTDARNALRDVLRERAQSAAGNNALVSKDEAARLDPFIRAAEQQLRAEAPKGARISVDAIVDRAMKNAGDVWDRFNPPGRGSDSAFLSQDELKQVERADPNLGELSRLAYLRAGKSGQDPVAVVRGFFDRFDFTDRALRTNLPGATKIDVRPGQPGRAGVPAEVLKGFDAFNRAMEADWATVTLHKAKVAGQDVYAVYFTTDGDDSVLELYSTTGKPLASARLETDKIFMWDEFFGRGRLGAALLALDAFKREEGLSEPPERAAAGQPPHQWPGDVQINTGFVHHQGGVLKNVDFPSSMTAEQREVATAGFELIYDRVWSHSRNGDEPFELGMRRRGTMSVGEWERPDGKKYLVADWHDIDDASFTFYFDRAEDGRLRLAIEQFNN